MLLQKQDYLSNPLLSEAIRRAVERRRDQERADSVLLAQRAGIDPDPWQRNVLRSQARQQIMLISRQAGKSTTTALKALHKAEYSPGSLTLLLAPSYRQSKELFLKIRESYHNAPGLSEVHETALEMEFKHGSRIVALPGKEETIRGFSGVALLVVDEASRVPDALYNAVRPMLAVSGGEIVLLSTPFGKRGFFFEVWDQGGTSWERTKVTAYECPRIPRDWLDLEREQIGDFWFEQEYMCEFKDDVSAVFRYADIQNAMNADIQPRSEFAEVLNA
jgi:hypothetical protein